MNEAEYEKQIAALEREVRILKQKLVRCNSNRQILEESLETQSNALKVRNLELEESWKLIRNSEAKFRDLAHHDILTGLSNRAYFEECLNRMTAEGINDGAVFALLFIDLDRFKYINDSFGHKAGDDVLTQTADRILACISDKDIGARLGGDEFAVILTDLQDVQAAEHIGAAILEVMSKPYSVGPDSYRLGVSIGISLYPYDDTDPDKLLQKADSAMYSVKRSGISNYQLYRDMDVHNIPYDFNTVQK
jgi:diguanylate cyclase (GGDEF)-like protein